jgi:hypothetical protein
MNSQIVKTALAAAAFAGFILSSSAQAQSYGGAPECGFGHSFNPVTQSCVSNRGPSSNHRGRAYIRRFKHTRHSAHRGQPVRVAGEAARANRTQQ